MSERAYTEPGRVRRESCDSCRYWDSTPEPAGEINEGARVLGACRAFAPAPNQFNRGTWPLTSRADWCGQWESDR